jgi:phosphate uptake regulator
MPIDEGVNIDLQFLILEVKKQARASLAMLEKPSVTKLAKIKTREDYVDNLKNTLETKSYFNIHQRAEGDGQVNYFRALISIGANLERCSDFFESIARQMQHVSDPASFEPFELKKYYALIFKALDLVYPALSLNDLDQAQKICDYEIAIDDLYDASYTKIRSNLRQRRQVDDMLSLLTIVRYLERVGDNFLKIGEAVLNIHVGESMGINQFRYLRRGLESQGIDIRSSNVEFKPIMNTRSGGRVAKIVDRERGQVFYKEGETDKIDEEIRGLALWEKQFPGLTPGVLWHDSREAHSTILLQCLDGIDMLELLINSRSKLDKALDILTSHLVKQWDKTKKNKPVKVDYVLQMMKRKGDIQSVHAHLLALDDELDSLLAAAKKLEKQLRAPFGTLIHGDFNIDNIIFHLADEKMYFVDVHRSGYGDYAQDVSVFLVSNIRIPLFSKDIRQRLNESNRRMYACAAGYAAAHQDGQFDARLAMGLFRSLITSTRFMFDKSFSQSMYHRAILILQDVLAHKGKLDDYKLREDYFLYG